MALDLDRPWRNVVAGAPEPAGVLKAMLPNEVPDLVWCIMYRSELQYKDRVFIAAFAMQNRGWFRLENLEAVVRQYNRHYTQYRWYQIEGVLTWLLEKERNIMQEGMDEQSLCAYYAYDCTAGRVLDLRGHPRHFDMGYPFFRIRNYDDYDPCAPYIEDYNRLRNVRLAEIVKNMPCVKTDEEGNHSLVVSVSDSAAEQVYAECDVGFESEDLPEVYEDDSELIEALEWLGNNYELFHEATLDEWSDVSAI